jgi:tetratricopeptide (TPR) repeat protein
MGFLDRILRRGTNEPIDDGVEGLSVLTGTTTFCRDAINALASRHGAADGGYLELPGSLQREPENQADPNAVAVMVEGERVGYLPSYATAEAGVDLGSRAVRVQIFTEMLPKGLRAEAWAWLGNRPPKWEWSERNRPPMSSKAKAMANHEGSRDMVREALAGGGKRAEEFKRGMVNGVHYLELVEPIKELKREGRLDEALALCYAAIEGAEASRDGREPAPFYTEQAAIVLRKLGRRDDEIAVLKRWLALCPRQYRADSRIGIRLAKLEG